MNIKDLEKFADWENKRLRKLYKGKNISPRERKFIRMIKINEELGELNDQMLGSFGIQRKCKKNIYNKKKISKEIVDVFLTTSLLANELGIDLEKNIKNKIEIIKKRNY